MAAIGIVVPAGTTFTIDPLNTAIAVFGAGSSLGFAATDPLLSLNLNPATCVGINCVPFVGANDWKNIGTFHNSTISIYDNLIRPDDDSVPGTIFDAQLNVDDVGCIELIGLYGGRGMSCAVGGFISVPEPTPLALLALAALALRLTRRE